MQYREVHRTVYLFIYCSNVYFHRPTEQILLCCLYGVKPPGPRRPEKPSHVLCGGDGPLTSDSEHCHSLTMAGSATTQCRAAVPDATAGAAAVASVAAATGATASATGARVPLASLPPNAMVAAPPAGGAAVAAPSRPPATRKAQAPVRVLNDLEHGADGKKQRRGVGKAKARAASAQAASASLAKNMEKLAKVGRTLSLEGTVAGAAACADTHATVMHVVCVKGRLRHTKEGHARWCIRAKGVANKFDQISKQLLAADGGRGADLALQTSQ